MWGGLGGCWGGMPCSLLLVPKQPKHAIMQAFFVSSSVLLVFSVCSDGLCFGRFVAVFKESMVIEDGTQTYDEVPMGSFGAFGDFEEPTYADLPINAIAGENNVAAGMVVYDSTAGVTQEAETHNDADAMYSVPSTRK